MNRAEVVKELKNHLNAMHKLIDKECRENLKCGACDAGLCPFAQSPDDNYDTSCGCVFSLFSEAIREFESEGNGND